MKKKDLFGGSIIFLLRLILYRFRSVLWFSVFGVIFMLMTWWIVARDAESYKEMTENLEPSINNLSKAEVCVFVDKFYLYEID